MAVLVPMVQVEAIGLLPQLDDALRVLQRLQCVEVAATQIAAPEDGIQSDTQPDAADRHRLDRLTRLRGLAPAPSVPFQSAPPDPTIDHLLAALEPEVDRLRAQSAALAAEADGLPRHIEALVGLQPLIPALSRLDDGQLAALGLASIALVLEDPQGTVIPELGRRLHELLGPTHMLVTSPPDAQGHVGAMLVLGRRRIAEVHALLGTERIEQAGIPDEYAGQSLGSTLVAMRERLSRLPAERAAVEQQMITLLAPHAATFAAADRELRARLERFAAARAATCSPRTFSLRGWVPADRADRVQAALTAAIGPSVVVHQVDGPAESPPVLLRNRRGAIAFQNLVGFLSWPAARTVDPTGLMAFALPVFFGVMVGDVGYGLCLLGIAWLIRRRVRGDFGHQAAHVLALGGGWAVMFGVLFGEFFGSFGHHLGMPALWFYRGGPAALQPLLLFALTIGLVHVVIGLGIGVWVAARLRRRGQMFERIGNLLVLVGLFALAGVGTAALPEGALTPGVALVIVGLVTATASQGAMGLLLGPLGVLGVIGNVLSYLRLAAVGLASVYLAGVANSLAGEAPLLLGIVVAAFFHALNLALAVFSPLVQSLRLHYVEFFGQFHEGDGRLFSPLGAGLVDPHELLDDLVPNTAHAAVATPPTEPPPADPLQGNERN